MNIIFVNKKTKKVIINESLLLDQHERVFERIEDWVSDENGDEEEIKRLEERPEIEVRYEVTFKF